MTSSAPALTPKLADQYSIRSQFPGHIRVGILVKRFPKLSETFIQGEINALIEAGVDIRIISLYWPNERMQQPGSDALLDRVCYLDELTRWKACLMWLSSLARQPLITLRQLRDCGLHADHLMQTAALATVCDTLALSHLHVHYLSEPAELALRVCPAQNLSFSISAHAKDIYLSDRAAIHRRINGAAFVTTCTGQNGVYLRELAAGNAHKIHVIYHGIDCTHFRPRAHASENQAKRIVTILATGRFKPKKGFDTLIDACALLIGDGYHLTCSIIGYGDEESALQQRIVDHVIAEHVKLMPPVTHAQMVDELRAADLFVLPCRQCADGDRDGIPNALLEAMACGVPVISTRVSGIPEVVDHGVNGMLVEPDDAADLAVVISQLSADAELQQELARSARQTVIEKFNWQASTRSLLSLIMDTSARRFADALTFAPFTRRVEDGNPAPLPAKRLKIAYVLKGFPRLSESFVTNEVRQLQAHALDLGLFSIKRGDGQVRVDDLPAVNYAPAVTPVSNVSLGDWLVMHLPAFMAEQRFWLARYPVRYISTLLFAVRLAIRHRSSQNRPNGRAKRAIKKAHIKEFLLATHIAHRVIEQGGYQHIHAHFCHDATTVAWMVSRLCRLPFSFTAHAKDIYQRRLNPRDFLQRKLNAAAFAVTCTKANVEVLRALATDPRKVHGIYHGLDTRLFVPRSAHHAKDWTVSDLPLILSVGRHVEKKGFVFLIEASRILRDRGIHHRVHIVGDEADQTEHLQRMIDKYALGDTIKLLPPLPQHKLVKCYHQARLFALPCIILEDGDRDGIPNVMAEAMACALPVVVTGISGIPEMIDHEETGLIVAQRDSVALADAIERLLVDDALAERLGSAARRRVEARFDANITHIELKELFYSQLYLEQRSAA